MRILVVGEFVWDFYERAFCDALQRGGAEVEELAVFKLFGPGARLARGQLFYVAGPGLLLANLAVAWSVWRKNPEMVLAWRCPWLWRTTIRFAQRRGAKVVLYNNDDPFGPDRGLRIWRAFRRTIAWADACFCYRRVNLDEYQGAGARAVFLMPPGFGPGLGAAPEMTSEDLARFGCDVVFAGHYEDDGRERLIEALAGSGLRVRVHGTDWDRARWSADPPIPPVRRASGPDYAKAIAGGKVALALLSHRNRDQYTRRCFEIPAIGTAMLAPRNPELSALFEEGAEALFFSGEEELAAQAARLVNDDALRRRIAAGGHRRAVESGYDLDSRARQFLADAKTLLGAPDPHPARGL